MAGANNAQMKAAGWKARDVTKQRAISGKLSHDVMGRAGFKPKKGMDPRAKNVAPPSGWAAAAARARGQRAQRKDAEAFRKELAKPDANTRRLDSLAARIQSRQERTRPAAAKEAAAKAAPVPVTPAAPIRKPNLAGLSAGNRAVAMARHQVAKLEAEAAGKDMYHPAVAKLSKAKKALRAAYDQLDSEG